MQISDEYHFFMFVYATLSVYKVWVSLDFHKDDQLNTKGVPKPSDKEIDAKVC